MDNAVFDVWDCNDPNLPLSKDIKRQVPDKGFIESIENVGQLNPIIINKSDDTPPVYKLLAGRARLLAIRDIASRGGDPSVYVNITHGLSDATQAAITLVENAQRSVNPVSDYRAAKSLLFSGMSYSDIAKKIGMPMPYVRKLDQQFAAVPDWALEAIQNEMMVVNTAIELGKLSDSAKEECKKEMWDSPKKKLTMDMVKSKHRLIQQDAAAQVTSLPGMSDLRRVFTRDELTQAVNLLQNNPDEALAYLTALLAETE